jgi:adenosylcobyric acid synthase
MNPVLLKPKGDTVSQVILHGMPLGDRKVGEYYDSTETIFQNVCESLKALARSYEVIVMEGAGSPAEINLYERDIANLRVARSADAPVVLVGDIERGGVFASLYGTVKLLAEDDQKRVKGFVINKFRGDEKLLEPGLTQLEKLIGIPVLGVIPYVNVRLTSEDSASLGGTLPAAHSALDIAAIRLPHISNFTDFEPLEAVARVRYVSLDDDLDEPDAIIIPGTKNTVDDLRAMRRCGMDKRIEARAGVIPIIGICGGFQMLGETLTDEGFEGTQNQSNVVEGLRLLHARTVFNSSKKRTKQVEKRVMGTGPVLDHLRNQTVRGYEIHMGSTASALPIFGDDGRQDATCVVLGTYLHGLFHNDNFRAAFLEYLRSRYIVKPHGVSSTVLQRSAASESQLPFDLGADPFDELARVVFEHVDMAALYSIIGL